MLGPPADRKDSVLILLEEMTATMKEYNRIRYPHSRFNRNFDACLAVLLLFTILISPFEIAFLDGSWELDPALFVINRFVDLGFVMGE